MVGNRFGPTTIVALHVVAALIERQCDVTDITATHSPAIFAEPELSLRRMLLYPPFSHLMKLEVSGTREPVVVQAAARWARLLREYSTTGEPRVATNGRPFGSAPPLGGGARQEEKLIVLGPSPAPHAKTRGRHHSQILMKAISVEAGRDLAIRTVEVLERGPRLGALRFDIDIDPISMG